MPWILKGLPSTVKRQFETSYRYPCDQPDQKMYEALALEFDLNPTALVFAEPPEACRDRPSTTIGAVLAGASVDEPDLGIDRDLSATADPTNDRRWMGGIESDDYRHMYFPGWNFSRPLLTFQIPTRPLGYAPDRVEKFANKARELIRAGNKIWGARVLGWSLHYAQDLSQPFHSVQIPHWRMLEWGALLDWPPLHALRGWIRASNRRIGVYHNWYENYVRSRLLEGERSPFIDCLTREPAAGSANPVPPKELAYRAAYQAIPLGDKLGRALVKSLPKDTATIEQEDAAGFSPSDPTLNRLTCEALANAALTTRALILWAFE